MFPPTTTGRPQKRSLRELVREAVDTAAAFATLGEASAGSRSRATRSPPRGRAHRPHAEHPHRRQVGQSPAQAPARKGRAPRPGLRHAGTIARHGAAAPRAGHVEAGLLGRRPPAGRDWEVSRAPAGRAPELHPPSGRPFAGAARERAVARRRDAAQRRGSVRRRADARRRRAPRLRPRGAHGSAARAARGRAARLGAIGSARVRVRTTRRGARAVTRGRRAAAVAPSVA